MNSYLSAFIIIFIAVVVVLALFRRSKMQQGEGTLDERQEMFRGRAYKYGLVTVVAAGIIYTFLASMTNFHFAEDFICVLIICFLGVLVFAVYAIFRDAFFAVRQKPVPYLLIMAVVTLANAGGAVRSIEDHTLVVNGLLSGNSIQLLCAALFFLILVAMVVKLFMTRKEEL